MVKTYINVLTYIANPVSSNEKVVDILAGFDQ